MTDLSTTYLGLRLRTPLVASASPVSQDLDRIRHLEDAGASAVILYSLFEEQLRREQQELEHHLSGIQERGHSRQVHLRWIERLAPAQLVGGPGRDEELRADRDRSRRPRPEGPTDDLGALGAL